MSHSQFSVSNLKSSISKLPPEDKKIGGKVYWFIDTVEQYIQDLLKATGIGNTDKAARLIRQIVAKRGA
ncbi:hypothetical protein B7C51_07805 [Paenibacillus larvae subsp. pulvifaciens]|uniref:Uncharacterized protein n=1 Tax=Paenibacillus larvae subsp. pulvifaciens TaxID=1477 RepID=A0A1V0US15_9BACL|nr:hypothetical protein B7C51_07805 [Paenibacillus larvae subsp. pulvifaciens]